MQIINGLLNKLENSSQANKNIAGLIIVVTCIILTAYIESL